MKMNINPVTREKYPAQPSFAGESKGPIQEKLYEMRQDNSRLHELIDVLEGRLKFVTGMMPELADRPQRPEPSSEIESELYGIQADTQCAVDKLNNLISGLRL